MPRRRLFRVPRPVVRESHSQCRRDGSSICCRRIPAARQTRDCRRVIALVFPGQGSQYAGMMRDLACQFPGMLAALVVLLITWVRMPAFLALAVAALFVGLAARMPLAEIPRAFQAGMGDTLGSIAMVIGLGTVIGKLLAESGGALVVSRALARALGERRLDWALMLSGFIIGLPVFLASSNALGRLL